MRKGFTLIEIVVTTTLMVILVSVYFLYANPAGQLASSRNSRRSLDLQTIMNAIQSNKADQSNEQFNCSSGSGSVPTTTKRMASNAYNIAPCLIPTYLGAMPFDPSASSSHYNSNSDYDTGYSIVINSSTGQITLSATYAELGKTITVTR